MHFPTTYAEALATHPDQVTEIIATLRKSRSKHRKAEPETLIWGYETGVRVQGYSFTDLFSGKAEAERLRQQALTEQEEADDLRARCLTSLQATIGQWFGSAQLPTPPAPVLAWTAQTVRERRQRQAEADALTPEEHAQALAELVNELPGLMCITVKRPEKP